MTVTLKMSLTSKAMNPEPESFWALPVRVGMWLAVYSSTTVGVSGVAMSTTMPLSLSRPVLPAASVTLAVMA